MTGARPGSCPKEPITGCPSSGASRSGRSRHGSPGQDPGQARVLSRRTTVRPGHLPWPAAMCLRSRALRVVRAEDVAERAADLADRAAGTEGAAHRVEEVALALR